MIDYREYVVNPIWTFWAGQTLRQAKMLLEDFFYARIENILFNKQRISQLELERILKEALQTTKPVLFT